MSAFRELSPNEMEGNVFSRIHQDWMLVGAKLGDRVNMMTASWGGLGVLWHKPVAYVFIRPQRYTKELVDAVPTLSLSFFDESHREQLKLCGSKSGRDTDKVAACGFTVETCLDAPVFQQAHTVLVCQKLYRQAMDPACFLDGGVCDAAFYPAKDYHDIYVAEIKKLLVR